MLSAVLLGSSCGLNLGLVTTVLVELVPSHTASLIALNSMARNLVGAVGGSVAQPLLWALGSGWLYTVLGSLAAANLMVMVLLKTRGIKWRRYIWDREKAIDECVS